MEILATPFTQHTTYGNSGSSSSSIKGDSERDFFVELWDVSGHDCYKDCRSLFYSQVNGEYRFFSFHKCSILLIANCVCQITCTKILCRSMTWKLKGKKKVPKEHVHVEFKVEEKAPKEQWFPIVSGVNIDIQLKNAQPDQTLLHLLINASSI